MSASGPRAVCVTQSTPLRRALRRTLNAAGGQVEFQDTVDGNEAGAALVFIDKATRRALSGESLDQLQRLVVIGDSLEDAEVVELLRRRGLNHIISDADDPDDTELVADARHLLHLAWAAGDDWAPLTAAAVQVVSGAAITAPDDLATAAALTLDRRADAARRQRAGTAGQHRRRTPPDQPPVVPDPAWARVAGPDRARARTTDLSEPLTLRHWRSGVPVRPAAQVRAYSCRSASIGFRRAARRAGK